MKIYNDMALVLQHVVLKWDEKHPSGVTITSDELFKLYALSMILDEDSDMVGTLNVEAPVGSTAFATAVAYLRNTYPDLTINVT